SPRSATAWGSTATSARRAAGSNTTSRSSSPAPSSASRSSAKIWTIGKTVCSWRCSASGSRANSRSAGRAPAAGAGVGCATSRSCAPNAPSCWITCWMVGSARSRPPSWTPVWRRSGTRRRVPEDPMHSARYNVLRLELRLEPAGPLLIKAGGYAADPSLPDMSFVRTARADGQETVYIPGSSVKGVLRGFVEQALRTIDDRQGWMWACPTFPSNAESCGKRLEKEERSCEVYRQSCGACRLFGHTRLRGRLAVTDLMPAGEVRTETRYGV